MFEMILVLALLIILIVMRQGTSSRIARLETELATLQADLSRLASALEQPPAAEPRVVTEAVTEPPQEAAETGVVAMDAVSETAASEAAPSDAIAAAQTAKSSIENNLGSRWAVWVGGVALALGGVLMVRYSIENGLISPAVRLVLSALFGLMLLGAGEWIRRRGIPSGMRTVSDRIGPNAMIPGILTAAGGVSLFASIYAAHQLYGFLGSGTAFVLMGLVAIVLLGLSLFHGQALAGLGMLGGLATPALVEQQAQPNIPMLMVYVVIVWLGSMATSRLRGWQLVPVLATLGACGWILLGGDANVLSVAPPVSFVAILTASALLTPDAPRFGATKGSPQEQVLTAQLQGHWAQWVILALTGAMAGALYASNPALLVDHALPTRSLAILFFIGLTIALRRDALPAVPLFGLGALMVSGNALETYAVLEPDTFAGPTLYRTLVSVITSTILILASFAALRLGRHRGRPAEIFWSAVAITPVALLALSWFDHGNWVRDASHAVFAAATALALLLTTDRLIASRETSLGLESESILVTGAFLSAAGALFLLVDGIVLVAGFTLLGLVFFLAHRYRRWRSLPFMMVAGAVLTAARIGWDPTIVGQDHLGTTPVFNALLPSYGIPTAVLALAAWLSRRMDSALVTRLLDAASVLMSFLTLAVLVRHGMNHGVLIGPAPDLGETSIYTLLTIGFSGALLQIDRRDASPVFVYGSMIAGAISMISVLLLHLGARNPYFTGELVGNWPLINLLLPGYLLPALCYGALALTARNRRPYPYVVALAVAGAILGFAWLTLSVRQLWQGTSLADWQGFFEGETYTYSVVWLLSGVLLLVLGTTFRAVSLRYASAAVVIVTVLKVFLIDLSNLEGLLRALSFIGLGLALIGIGLFYQRLLLRSARAEVTAPDPSPS